LIEHFDWLPLPRTSFRQHAPKAREWEMECQRQHLVGGVAIKQPALGVRSLIRQKIECWPLIGMLHQSDAALCRPCVAAADRRMRNVRLHK